MIRVESFDSGCVVDDPPLNGSTLKYGLTMKEDYHGTEATQARRDRDEAAAV